MNKDISLQILNKIKEYNTIIIHRHLRPDGDCIGSQMGLKQFIIDNFPSKNVYAVGDIIPDYLNDLGENNEITDDIYQKALVIVVDTSTKARICDNRYDKGAFLIKLDHHDDSEPFGDIEYVDPLAPACSSIIVSFIKEFEGELVLSTATATALYMGIVTDTGRFRYRGLNSETLTNAGYLIDHGVDTENLYVKLYIKSIEELKLQGAISRLFKITPNGVAYIYFNKKLMKKYNVSKEDAANQVNFLDGITGSLIWVAFVEQMKKPSKEPHPTKEAPEKEIRVRLRSRFVAINEVANHFRGGGHLLASGATVYSKKEVKALLKELDELLGNYKKEHPEVF